MERVFKILLPENEVQIKKQYCDDMGNKFTIESGDNGWTILSYDFYDYDDNNINDYQCNFDIALESLKTLHPTITEI